MKKKLALILALTLVVSLLSGCAGTTVVVGNCTCPTEGPAETPVETQAPAVTEAPPAVEAPAPAEGALKTGLAIVTGLNESTSATAEAEGKAKYDVTIAAVTVDANGVIHSCSFDSVGTEIAFDASGVITTDLTAAPATKTELGDAYGMKAYAGSKYEWYEQAAAVASCAVGKTVEEFKAAAANPGGDADLATTATIYIGGYVSAIEQAAANALDLGAQNGDTLKLAILSGVDSSAAASAEKNGTAQLDVNVAVITMNGETITSCLLDAVQAKVSFDASGAITSDVASGAATKNELGEAYGMKAYAGSQYEWNEQAANFSAYVTGKTPADVAGIAVTETTVPTDADLASGVTIAIGGFQALIAKAAG